MKFTVSSILAATAIALSITACSRHTGSAPSAATASSDEAAFLTAWRTAIEKSDSKTLDSFFLADGAPAEIVELYKLMNTLPPGTSVVNVTLETPSSEDAAKFSSALPMPDGKSYKLPIVPTKKLVMTMKSEGVSGNSTSTATLPVAIKDGRFVIPLPVPAA